MKKLTILITIALLSGCTNSKILVNIESQMMALSEENRQLSESLQQMMETAPQLSLEYAFLQQKSSITELIAALETGDPKRDEEGFREQLDRYKQAQILLGQYYFYSDPLLDELEKSATISYAELLDVLPSTLDNRYSLAHESMLYSNAITEFGHAKSLLGSFETDGSISSDSLLYTLMLDQQEIFTTITIKFQRVYSLWTLQKFKAISDKMDNMNETVWSLTKLSNVPIQSESIRRESCLQIAEEIAEIDSEFLDHRTMQLYRTYMTTIEEYYTKTLELGDLEDLYMVMLDVERVGIDAIL